MSDIGVGKASNTGLTVRAEEFSACMRELQRTLRGSTTFRNIVDHEVARVCERAAELTGNADRQKIRSRVKNRATFKINGKTYNLRDWKTGQVWRVPPSAWAEIQVANKRSLAKRLAAVGITRRSWYDIAKKLGHEIKVPAFVASSHVSAPSEKNTDIKRQNSDSKYGVLIIDRHPLLDVPATQGVRAFYSALTGRIRFYEQNLARGVFDDLKKAAAKYPGMKVT